MAPLVNRARLRAFFLPAGGGLRWPPYLVVAAAGIVAGILLGFSEPIQGLDWRLYDAYSRRIGREPDPAPAVVVVAIDEPSFAEIGIPWPWPRSLHATLVDRLAEAGARTIAFDILFDAPSAAPDDDLTFADAIRKAGNVVLAADRAVIDDRQYALTQWIEPVAPLAAASRARGVVRIPFDPDGALRRVALTIDQRPSLALAVTSGTAGLQTPRDPGRPRLFRFNGSPRQGIVTVSYYQALDPAQLLPPGMFKDKYVLIGRALAATTIDKQGADFFPTPVAVQMAGVEVHATIVDALLRRHFIADPFESPWLAFAACIFAGALVAMALYRLGPAAAPLLAGGLILVLLAGGYLALRAGVRVPLAAPAIVIAGVYAVTAAYRYGLSTRERRMIKRAFQHYVAPAIVEQMLNDPSRLKLGGQEYEVTVLFSDLEGFTTLSERLGAAALSAHLGGYFKAMLDRLLAEHGTLDKLIGDAIMMYFGCPIPDERHAVQACRGALAMQAAMTELNAKWSGEGLPQLRTRVGINTGRAVAGNMGTDTIFNYTILGDCVNLASRLEGVNKEYGTLIIVAEETHARTADLFEYRELDWIRVKGKVNPVAIFELAAERGRLPENRRELFAAYAAALALYRDGQWSAAADACMRALAIDADDGPARTLAARCAYYAAHPPVEWHGVHVMTTK